MLLSCPHSKRCRLTSPTERRKVVDSSPGVIPMPKNKSHKGLSKRIRVSKTGKVRHRTAFHKHLSSRKSAKRLRQLRKDRHVVASEAKRFEKLLFRRLRGRNQARTSLRRSPSPEQKRAMREAAKNSNND